MKKPIYKRKWFIVVVAIILLGVIGSAIGGDSEKTDKENKGEITETANNNNDNDGKDEEKEKEKEKEKEPTPEVVISSKDLSQQYEDNEIKANKNYKDKLVEITGEVRSIDEVLSSTYVVLSADKDFALTEVQCFFKDEDQIDKIAEISKGDEVTIIGTVKGKSLNVEVKDCKFKE